MNWISVKDDLPPEWESVLGFMPDACPFPCVRECYRIGDRFFFPALIDFETVTYWQEMPKPPCEIAENIESCKDCGFCEVKRQKEEACTKA